MYVVCGGGSSGGDGGGVWGDPWCWLSDRTTITATGGLWCSVDRVPRWPFLQLWHQAATHPRDVRHEPSQLTLLTDLLNRTLC